MSNYLEDPRGNKSSKRLWGSVMICFGIEMKLILFHYALFKLIATPFYDLDNCANWMISVGSALLGVGIVEMFSKIK